MLQYTFHAIIFFVYLFTSLTSQFYSFKSQQHLEIWHYHSVSQPMSTESQNSVENLANSGTFAKCYACKMQKKSSCHK